MAQKFIINTSTEPATFTTKNITINITKDNISKFFEVDYADNAFYRTTHDGGFAIQADEADGTLKLKSKYNFSNVFFKYDYVHSGSSNSSITIDYHHTGVITKGTKITADTTAKGCSYSPLSKGDSLDFVYDAYYYSSKKKQSKITIYDIKIELSIFDILLTNSIDSDLEVFLNSNTAKIAFSNLNGLRALDL